MCSSSVCHLSITESNVYLLRKVRGQRHSLDFLPAGYPILDIHSINLMKLNPKKEENRNQKICIDKYSPISTSSETIPCNQTKKDMFKDDYSNTYPSFIVIK